MKINVIKVVARLLVILLLVSMTGCGGGTSTTETPVISETQTPVAPATVTPAAPAIAPTKATLKLSINNLPASVKAGALQFSFTLPTGVIPSSLSGNDATGSINLSSNVVGLPSASFASQVVTVGVISSGGLAGGELLTMNCSISPGTTVLSAAFPVKATVEIADDTGTPLLPIAGLTVPIIVAIQ